MPPATFELSIDPHEYLVRVAGSPVGRAYKSSALTSLGLEPGHAVLDLGCGPGADLAGYADAVGPDGRVVGVDHDSRAVARARSGTAGLPQVDVRAGDVQALDLPDGSFDAVHADRVLQHVPDPVAAVREATRVLRPGGRAVFAEPDWQTLVVDHPETRLSEAFTRYVTHHQIRNPRMGRQLKRLCHQEGLGVEAVMPFTATFDDAQAADQVLGFHRVTARAVEHGLMSEPEAQRWIEHLAHSQPFFASVTLFMVVARRDGPDGMLPV